MKPEMVAHVCNPNTQETEAEESHIQGQPGPHRVPGQLHSETLSQKEKKKEKRLK
jgi:hypothetical protein